MTHSLTETLAVLGNSNHLLGFIEHYEAQIEVRRGEASSLSYAPNYYAWLSVTSEYVYYAVKQLVFLRSQASDTAVFNLTCTKLLEQLWAIAGVTQRLKDDILLFARIRHLLVHKGFPNPHDVPTLKERSLEDGVEYTANEVWEVRNRLKSPREYTDFKPVFARVIQELAGLRGTFKMSF